MSGGERIKLLHVTFQVQYTDHVEAILADCGLDRWARHHRVYGRDADGRHEGSQAFPGHVTAIQAQVPEERVECVLDALEEFRRAKRVHRHLEALVLPVERRIGASAGREGGEAARRGPVGERPGEGAR